MNAYDVFVIRFESNANRRYLPIPGLRRVFGIDQKTAEKIAQNLPRVVKRRVAIEVAAQYADALKEIGAVVQLRPSQDRSKTPQSISLAPPSPVVSSSESDESTGPENVKVDPTQANPCGTDDASVTGGTGGTPDGSERNSSELSSHESSDSHNLQRPSHTVEPEMTESRGARSAQQPLGDLLNRGSNKSSDDDPSKTSTQPSTEEHTLSRGSNRPHPLPQHEQNATSAQDIDATETTRKGSWTPGAGYILAGTALISIGLSYDGSIFTGNAGIADWFFDVLGMCWIVWGLFILVKKSRRPQLR